MEPGRHLFVQLDRVLAPRPVAGPQPAAPAAAGVGRGRDVGRHGAGGREGAAAAVATIVMNAARSSGLRCRFVETFDVGGDVWPDNTCEEAAVVSGYLTKSLLKIIRFSTECSRNNVFFSKNCQYFAATSSLALGCFWTFRK